MRKMIVILTFLLLPLAGCDNQFAVSDVELRTDRSSYNVGDEIVLSITNLTEHRIAYTHFLQCHVGLPPERRVAGGWEKLEFDVDPQLACQAYLPSIEPSQTVEQKYVIPDWMTPGSEYRIPLSTEHTGTYYSNGFTVLE